MTTKTVLILSGGMDSVTLLHQLIGTGHEVHAVTFDYGQRHSKEIESARYYCKKLGAPHKIVDLSSLKPLLGGSALTDDIEVPDGHYEEESMRVTVVPNRNMIMLSIAWAYATSIRARNVATAVHAGDHFIYPDCRAGFISSVQKSLKLAVEGMDWQPENVLAPYVHISKIDIAAMGKELGIAYQHTWTCYKGEELHCGTCGSCVERKEALGPGDPTEYAT